MNTLKAGLLLTALTGLFIWIGNLLGGTGGMAIALVIAVAMNMGTYWFSDKVVLKMTRAEPLDRAAAPAFYAMVDRLSQKAGIPAPRLFVVPDPSPNAFATGRNPKNGVVAVNQGLLDILDEREVEGVVAHEIGHIKHRDTLTMAIVATLAGAVSMIANILQFAAIFGGGGDEEGRSPLGALAAALIAPIAAMLIQMGVSRMREFEADKTAAEITGDPDGLASALDKLHAGVLRTPGHMPTQAAHMCIVNPFFGLHGLTALFSTHPPVQERIRRLGLLKRASI